MRVLIIGGYGVFGGRLARLLADRPELTLLIAGRSTTKARAFCAEWAAHRGASMQPAAFDRDGDVAGLMAGLAPQLVVDCSGPFQAYGAAPFRVVEACIAQGVPYLDLADGRDFVVALSRFDAAAKAAGVFVIGGTSTCPALTSAAVAAMTEGWTAVENISAGIAPSPHAGVGENVIRAITSYAGKPVEVLVSGQVMARPGLVDAREVTIAPPGKLPLRTTLFVLVDVPDLVELPRLWPTVGDIWMGAGPRPELLHRMLIGLGWLVSRGLPLPLARFSGLFHAVKSRLRYGEDRGGMFVRLAGRGPGGEPLARSWNLTAEGDDGPFIPSMAAASIVLGLLEGRRPESGARSAVGEVGLADYQRLFDTKQIATGVRVELPTSEPVYRQVLSGAWEALPPAIRAMHDLKGRSMTARGRATVTRGRSPLAWLAGAVIGFPKAQTDGPVEVAFERSGAVEVWTRTFGDQSFTSRQSAGTGRSTALAVESFGPMGCGMAPVLAGDRLLLIARRWTVFGIGLPTWLFPRIEAFEGQDGQGRFTFHVDISHPLTGPIVLYQGWLEIV